MGHPSNSTVSFICNVFIHQYQNFHWGIQVFILNNFQKFHSSKCMCMCPYFILFWVTFLSDSYLVYWWSFVTCILFFNMTLVNKYLVSYICFASRIFYLWHCWKYFFKSSALQYYIEGMLQIILPVVKLFLDNFTLAFIIRSVLHSRWLAPSGQREVLPGEDGRGVRAARVDEVQGSEETGDPAGQLSGSVHKDRGAGGERLMVSQSPTLISKHKTYPVPIVFHCWSHGWFEFNMTLLIGVIPVDSSLFVGDVHGFCGPPLSTTI